MPTETRRRPKLTIRQARPREYSELGKLTVQVYRAIPSAPRIRQHPDYYRRLRNLSERSGEGGVLIFVALDATEQLLGCVDFIEDGTGFDPESGILRLEGKAALRHLIVRPGYRAQGVGPALVRFCMHLAHDLEFPARYQPSFRIPPNAGSRAGAAEAG